MEGAIETLCIFKREALLGMQNGGKEVALPHDSAEGLQGN